MKKLTCCLLTLAIIFSFAFSGAAWAEGPSHFELETEAGKLELKMDEEYWYVFTRENLKDNPELEEIGIDYELQAQFMDEENIIMDAFVFYEGSDLYVEMMVREVELSQYCNFAELSAAQLKALSKKMSEEFDSENGGVIKNANGLNFVNHEFFDGDFYVKEFLIAVGDRSFDFLFQCAEPFVDEEYEEMEAILDSIEFTPGAKAESGAEGSLRQPSMSELLDRLGLESGTAWGDGLSRFELETEGGTLTLKMDEKFWYVFTRDNLKDNPELDELGIDPEYQAQFMEENDVILDAIVYYEDSDAYLQMFLRETETDDYYELNKLSDAELEELAEDVAEVLGRENVEVFKSDKNLFFINYELYDSGVYVKEYITLVENINFDILFQSKYPFSDEHYEKMESILDSMEFTPNRKVRN